MIRRVLIGYGVDVDAVSGWIDTQDGHAANETDVSRGVFGATVGTNRLLKLFSDNGIKATWFVPAHTIESFPQQMAKIRDAGHEIGLHGYTHEIVSNLSAEQERDVLAKSIDVLTAFTGQRPKGWTAPAWSTSEHSVALLEEYGIEYDHSFMHHDSQLYYLPSRSKFHPTDVSKPAETWMHPIAPLLPSKIVEVPANWHLDDWPPMQPEGGHGYVDTYVVERMWKDQFKWLYDSSEKSFVFPMSIHPQVSGKPQVMAMHQRLIDFFRGYQGVEWCTMEEMVQEFKEGRIEGVRIEDS